MPAPNCPLCKKNNSLETLPTEDVVWQFPHSIAYLGPWQFYQGYCVLVSRMHATELGQLDPQVRAAFLEEMCVLARAIEDCFHPHKLNYELLGNQVPHLHWHIFPRYRHDLDVLKPVWLALDRADHDEAERTQLQTGSLSRVEISQRLSASLGIMS